jgi:hypothetical protein
VLFRQSSATSAVIMPSVFSRLSSLMTPQWISLLLAGLVALKLAQRMIAQRRAAATLLRAQALKRARRDAEMALMTERIQVTEVQRSNGKEEAIVSESATQLVQKMAAGQFASNHSALSH